MQDNNKDFSLPKDDFLADQPPLDEEFFGSMPELELAADTDVPSIATGLPHQQEEQDFVFPDLEPEAPAPVIFPDMLQENSLQEPADVILDPEPDFSSIPMDDPAPAAAPDPAMYEEAADSSPEYTQAPVPFVEEPAFIQDILQEEALPDSTENTPAPVNAYAVPTDSPVAEEDTLPVPERPRSPRKGRPKRKKGYGFLGIPHILATGVWLAIILVIGTTLGRFLWVCAADVLAFGRESNKVSVTITSNDTIEDIARKLHEAGLVRNPWLFKLYADIAVDEGDIIPGTFEMDTLYDYHALVVQMGPRSSNRAVVEDVLIPEGLNCRQIFALLEEKGICTVEELEEYAANGEFSDFWFLEGVERGDKYCLEGFLFPDTYDFYANSTPREALGKMLLGFEDRFTEDIYSQLPALNERLSSMMRKNGCSEEFIASHQLDLRDLLTVASLIEEETASAAESPTIASVIYNRLTQDLEYERYLGIDAAIIYATGDANNIDTSIDSPYNTYIHAGLTPGPITNPGLDSIRAALNPAETNYYYYVLNPETRLHDFSVTLEEHEQKVEKYREMTAGEEE